MRHDILARNREHAHPPFAPLPLCPPRSALREGGQSPPFARALQRMLDVLDAEQSAAIRERFAKNGKVRCNSRMSAQLLKRHCTLDESAEGMMKMAMTELNFSARAYDRILKVARTIADLAASERIESNHLLEAIQYRSLDRNVFY